MSKDIAADGRDTTGWCHGFKPHLLCNGYGEVMTFRLTKADVDDRDARVWNVSVRNFMARSLPIGNTLGGNSLKNSSIAAYTPSRVESGDEESMQSPWETTDKF